MTELRHMDFSRIRDEDLTAEQRKEIERRFQAFAGALARVQEPGPRRDGPEKDRRQMGTAGLQRPLGFT